MVTLYKQHLEALGHEVTIFTLGDEQDGDREARIVRSPGFRLGDHGYFVGLRYSREAQMLLTKMEVVHCHHLLMSVEMAHRYARCPIVYTNHTRYDLYTGAYTPLPQPAADAIMRQLWPEFAGLADTVIAPSASVRQLLLDFGVREPIVVIENGIELEPFLRPRRPRAKADFGLPDDAFLLVYIGRLSSEKNVLGLLEQVARACQVVPEVHLAILGKGPQEGEMCIRDRISADLRELLRVWYGYKWEQAKAELRAARHTADTATTAWSSARDALLAPVSYTHLDVYKRQAAASAAGNRGGAKAHRRFVPN